MNTAYDFYQSSRAAIEKEASELASRIGEGACKDWGAYQLMAGRVKGLREAIKLMEDALKGALKEANTD